MTTGQCAKVLNAVVGERLFDDRHILAKVESGELPCINPHRGYRERAKITAKDFCHFVCQHYPEYLPAIQKRLGLAA